MKMYNQSTIGLMSLLLTADPLGAESAGGASFLDEDLSGVDTSLPLIKEGIYKFEVAKIEKVPTKDNTGELIKMTLKLAQDGAVDTNGNEVKRNFPVFHQISITPTEKYSKDDIKRAVAAFVQAAGGQKVFPLNQYEGKPLYAKLTVAKESTDKESGRVYPAKNQIGRFLKPEDIKG